MKRENGVTSFNDINSRPFPGLRGYFLIKRDENTFEVRGSKEHQATRGGEATENNVLYDVANSREFRDKVKVSLVSELTTGVTGDIPTLLDLSNKLDDRGFRDTTFDAHDNAEFEKAMRQITASRKKP